MYKLLALDIDGTTLNSQDKITPEVKKAIQAARAKGVHVVLCTGRSLHGIQDFLTELDMNNAGDFSITYNGALVQDNHTLAEIAHTPIDEINTRALLDFADSHNLSSHFFNKEGAFTTSKTIPAATVFECYHSQCPITYITEAEVKGNYSKFNISTTDTERFDTLYPEIEKQLSPQFALTRTFEFWVEITNKDATKGNAVKTLAEKLGIKPDEIITVGDQVNDLTMIEFAGLGVAMGNAACALKHIADYIAPSNDENGVAHVIEKFILSA